MRTIGMNMIKYILFFFNFLFVISGLAILLTGAFILADVNEYNYFLEGHILSAPIALIVTGAIIFCIAFLGCYGAMKESPNLLIIYAVLLAIVFIIELAVGISACIFKSDLHMGLKDTLNKSLKRSNADDLYAWDHAQRKLSCCGVESISDWRYLSANRTVPGSCCLNQYLDDTNDCKNSFAQTIDRYYKDGCLNKLYDQIGQNATILIGVAIGLAFIQFLGIFLACWLASAIRRDREK